MKYNHPQQKNWSLILKLQDQLSHEQDLKHKQQQKIHQKLYKQQLQSLIQQQKNKQKGDRLQQIKIMQYNTQKNNIIANKQYLQKLKWQKMRQNFSKDNYHSSLEKKNKLKQQIIDEKQRFSQRFKKISTQMSQQKQHQKRSYSLKQHQLALAYDQQLNQQHRRKLLSKDQDIRFQALAKRIQDQKEKQRQSKLNKIRFGYGQNPQIFKIVNQAQSQKISQRNNFISQLANSPKDISTIQHQQQQEYRKSNLRKQISTYNRQQFEQRHFNKKISLIQQTIQQKQKFKYINEMLQEERKQKQIQKQRQRRQLQEELERQIRQYQENKYRTKYMNPEEYKINSSLIKKNRITSGSLLPGVKYDNQLEKQQKLIERFLGGGSSRQVSRASSSSRT